MIETFEREFETNGIKKLIVCNPYGKVELNLWDKERIKITVTKEVNGKNKEHINNTIKNIEMLPSTENNILEIKTLIPPFVHILNGLSLTVNYLIYAPTKIEVEIDTTEGAVASSTKETEEAIVNLITSGRKSIIHNYSGDLSTLSEAGDIVVYKAQGTLNLQSYSGNIIVKEVKGELKIHSNSGNIDVDICEGNIDASSKSGNISISNARVEKLTAKSTSGNIELVGKRNVKEVCQLNSKSGNIRLKGHGIPPSQMKIITVGGRIQLKGEKVFAMSRDVPISIETSSGDIFID
ncbi:MAG: DUF4097 family beta strand repeat protein [Synergistetes bacterium]|nr:DUF4097 family beta strand repeat protein [Synergistota bacterium]